MPHAEPIRCIFIQIPVSLYGDLSAKRMNGPLCGPLHLSTVGRGADPRSSEADLISIPLRMKFVHIYSTGGCGSYNYIN